MQTINCKLSKNYLKTKNYINCDDLLTAPGTSHYRKPSKLHTFATQIVQTINCKLHKFKLYKIEECQLFKLWSIYNPWHVSPSQIPRWHFSWSHTGWSLRGGTRIYTTCNLWTLVGELVFNFKLEDPWRLASLWLVCTSGQCKSTGLKIPFGLWTRKATDCKILMNTSVLLLLKVSNERIKLGIGLTCYEACGLIRSAGNGSAATSGPGLVCISRAPSSKTWDCLDQNYKYKHKHKT